MVGCVLSQLKPSEFYILRCEKVLGLRSLLFSTAKNVELLWIYLIQSVQILSGIVKLKKIQKIEKNSDFFFWSFVFFVLFSYFKMNV